MAFAKRIVLFMLTNILIVLTVTTVLSLLGVSNYRYGSHGQYGLNVESLAIFCLVWGFVGSFISLLLSKVIAKWSMGVKIINPNTADLNEQFLIKSVYKMATAAGIKKMPEVGVYKGAEVNAFATGPTKNKALVAVSTGLLQRMNKDEVEGVLGHEVAHIANGDMVTMTLIQGVVNAFVMFFARIFASIVASALSGSRNDNERSPNTMIEFLLVIAFEIAFGILGMMVVGYFSRAREYRADAGGARLAGRQKMVAALQALRGTLDQVDTEHKALASLKISGRTGGLAALFSTHPSLESRIRKLQSL